MRIAFLTNEYPTERLFAGGLASYLRRTAHALVEAGHEAEVFTLSEEEGQVADAGVVVHRVGPGKSWSPLLAKTPLLWRYAGYGDVLAPAWRLAQALRRRHRRCSFDVVQAANYRAVGLVAACWRVAPLVTRVSSYEPLWNQAYQSPRNPWQRQRERAEVYQLRRSSAVYAPSQLLARTLNEAEGIAVGVVRPPFSPVGVEVPEVPLMDWRREAYGLFFGSIGLMKGCDRLVRALPAVLERNPDMKFAFIGAIRQAPDGRPFDAYIRDHLGGFGDRVAVLSEQRHETLLPIVGGARLVVLPSKIDNLPNACMEAMSLKRVVIGTVGASFEELIEDGRSGFLVSQDDDELASRMEAAWRMDGSQRECIGARARSSLDELEPEKTIRELVEFYRQAVGGAHRCVRRSVVPLAAERST